MHYYIVYNSITFASRIKNHFRYSGYTVAVVHTPAEISKGGCSYSVKVRPGIVKEILDVSKEFGFVVKGVYKTTDDGFKEVMV